MCGIIGQVNNNNSVDEILFNKMRDSFSHRGPDGYGTEFLNNGKTALGHRRLSIIDLSELGKQPMCNEDGTVWLTFNGEIYNFQDIKTELLKYNHIFKSQSDSEVLIHGYEQWGINILLSKIKGMFAFAILDLNKNKLFAVRDRFGIKPLYYYLDSEKLIFASEIKAIIKHPDADKSLDFNAMADFLIYRYVPAPKSIYKKIKKLKAGNFLEFDITNFNLQINEYWNLTFRARKDINFEQALSETNKLLKNSIKEHLVSDVPLGVFLSGGYDSTSLVHFMDQLKYPVKSFSIGFDGWEKSEHNDAQVIADLYKTNHQEQILPNQLGENIEKLSFYYDEPLGGSSFMPTFAVSKLAAQDVKVVLGGDGGDEVFAGYNWHYNILEEASTLKGKIKNTLKGSERLLHLYRNQMDWSGFTYNELRSLFSLGTLGDYNPEDIWLYKQYDNPKLSNIKRLQLLDFNTFLPEVINTKVDRATMAYSIEARVPFLDHELVDYVFQLPDQFYYEKGTKKKMLYEILKENVPEKILNKKKQGFGAPLANSTNFGKVILAGKMLDDGILNKNIVQSYIDQNQTKKIWALYLLENWYKCWNA